MARVAVRREVLAAVSNKNIFHMLQLFVDGIKAAGVPNSMVVALDDETAAWLQERQVAHYVKKIKSRTGSTDNHATSGLKFKILVDFLSVGASVLLSDVDVIWLQDPFRFLYRDSDVEGMSDGWDDDAAYGHTYELPLPAGSTPSGAAAPARWLRLVAAAQLRPFATPIAAAVAAAVALLTRGVLHTPKPAVRRHMRRLVRTMLATPLV